MLDEAKKVREALVARGLETPLNHTSLSADEKRERLTTLFTQVTETLGLDLTDRKSVV